MLKERTMKRIGEFSHRLARIQTQVDKLVEFSQRLEALVKEELNKKEE